MSAPIKIERSVATVRRVLAEAGVAPEAYEVRESIGELAEVLRGIGSVRPLLVLSREAVVCSGLLGEIQASLGGTDPMHFDEFTPNPTAEECVRAAAIASLHRADAVVGIGGGSAIDIAKLAAFGADRPRDLEARLRGEGGAEVKPLPVVAVPTTAGTGAEATHFAAVYIDGIKHSAGHPLLRPRAAVLDLRFHLAMPQPLAAVTGLDALSQAVESMWAVGATPESRVFAALAAELVSGAIRASVRHADADARASMMVGSHLAGHAINISKTTLAHALSYALTQRYGVPHGHAVGLLLGAVAEANAAHGPADLVAEALGCIGGNADTIVAKMRSLLSRLGLAPTLADVGVTADDLPCLARSVDPVRMSNNPAPLTHDQLVQLLRRARGD